MAKQPKSAVPDLSDLTDADAATLDAWIEAHLPRPEDGNVRGEWARRLCGTDPSKLVGNANPTRYLSLHISADFSRTLSDLAAERNMSRDSFIRVVLAITVGRLTGRTMDDVLTGMPPQRKYRSRSEAHLPSKPEGRPRKQPA
jgi:hypothetical protein